MNTALQQGPAGGLVPDTNFTVEEAARFLKDAHGAQLQLTRGNLSSLGKDCSMVCRIRNAQWTLRPTPTKDWPNERAYPPAIIREVFSSHPATRDYVPKGPQA
jgi:hypothetical protein